MRENQLFDRLACFVCFSSTLICERQGDRDWNGLVILFGIALVGALRRRGLRESPLQKGDRRTRVPLFGQHSCKADSCTREDRIDLKDRVELCGCRSELLLVMK